MSYPKLRGRIREKYGTQEAFAVAMGIHPATLSAKLQGRVDWSLQEMKRAAELLELTVEETPAYFF